MEAGGRGGDKQGLGATGSGRWSMGCDVMEADVGSARVRC